MTTVNVFAPAKINLTLHVTGRRADGYHELDSLVSFADVGDRLVIDASEKLSLTVEGPEAQDTPADLDNLALQATTLIANGRGARMTLEKILPIASGIGGGSADAAAAFRGMLVLNGEGEEIADSLSATPNTVPETHIRALLNLGADVPMCLFSKPTRVQGIGERLTPCQLPPVHALLANPRVPLSTAMVFRALGEPDNPPMPADIPRFANAAALIDWLANCRNDLEFPARSLVPEIDEVLAALNGLGRAVLARMSGSGATCFALFGDKDDAQEAETRLRSERPDWWVVRTVLGDQSGAIAPRIS